MTNPRDDLMALVTALQNADWPDVSIGNKALIRNAIERLTEAASRSATQVVDREAVARAICQSGKFETGEGTCALLCMDQLGSPRKKGCCHSARVHGKLADAILSLLRPAEPVDVIRPDIVAQRTWFDGENIVIENLTADDIYQKPTTTDAVSEPMAWDHRVLCACENCTEYAPENSVFAREDIGVMPDGTWLCENCYSDCEKTAYGMVANDSDDFEYPRFEDLPRPSLYTHPPKSPDTSELLKLAYDNMFDGEAREQIRRKLFE